MMRSLLFIIYLMYSLVGFSQTIETDFKGDRLTTDPFGNYYEISVTEIKKFNQSAELQYTYSNNLLGEIASVDATNPLKLLVYFRDFTNILILDNTLSPTSEVLDLTTIELEETSLVCRSYNDGIWYYNPVKFELIRKGNDLVTSNTSGNLSTLLNKNIQPNFLVEYNNKLYLNDPKNGILVLDNYGAYIKTIPIYNLSQFQVKEKFLIYVTEDAEITKYDFLTLENVKSKSIPLVSSVRIEGQRLYMLTKENKLFIDKIFH
jgi:hypothetical protein